MVKVKREFLFVTTPSSYTRLNGFVDIREAENTSFVLYTDILLTHGIRRSRKISS